MLIHSVLGSCTLRKSWEKDKTLSMAKRIIVKAYIVYVYRHVTVMNNI